MLIRRKVHAFWFVGLLFSLSLQLACSSNADKTSDVGIVAEDIHDDVDENINNPISLRIVHAIPAMHPGDEFEVQIRVEFEDGSSSINPVQLSWVMADPEIARVEQGKIFALSVGVTTLAVSYEDQEISLDVRVRERGSARIEIIEQSLLLGFPYGAGELSVVAYDADGAVVEDPVLSWSSSSPIFTVEDGHVKVLGIGTAVVSVEWNDVRDTVEVRAEAVRYLKVKADAYVLNEGETLQVDVQYFNYLDEELLVDAIVEWSVSDEVAASIDPDGLLRGKGGGYVRVTAKSAGKVGSEDFFVDVRFKDISCFHENCCALTTAGYAYCFGSNRWGHLGYDLGKFTYSNDLVPIPADIVFSQIDVAHAHICGLDFEGKAYCWGENRSGALGFGTPEVVYLEAQQVETDVRFRDIRTHDTGTYALSRTGELYAWGSFPPTTRNTAPPAVPTLTTPTLLDAGPWDGIAFTKTDSLCLYKNGEHWCLGNNLAGALGIGKPPEDSAYVTNEFSLWKADSPIVTLTGSGYTALCGLDDSGRVWCAGKNNWGIQGYPFHHQTSYEYRHYEPTLTGWPEQVFEHLYPSNGVFFCGQDVHKDVWCWGQTSSCQLGWNLGNDYTNEEHGTAHSHVPVQMEVIPEGFKKIALAHYAGCIVNDAGEVQCWGLSQTGNFLQSNLNCNSKSQTIVPTRLSVR